MSDSVRRGFDPGDERIFSAAQLALLRRVQKDIVYLLDHGYGLAQTVRFVGDRFQLSLRQRTALTRATCSSADLSSRRRRELPAPPPGGELTIDGFNLIITLEAALSGSTVLLCRDGTLRDLCGLRGTYRLIGRTDRALQMISSTLEELRVGTAFFILDRPVSNSGRLKSRILEATAGRTYTARVELSDHADKLLTESGCVATSDSIVLNGCKAWVNLARRICNEKVPDFKPVDLSCGAEQ